MDRTLLAGALALFVLLSLIGMLLYRRAAEVGFSISKWFNFRFMGSNQPSRETAQEAGVKVEAGVQLTAKDIVGGDKITNIYSMPSEANTALSQSLFTRLKFLDGIDENSDADKLEEEIIDLVKFIERLQQGIYFAQRISVLIERPQAPVLDAEWSISTAEYAQQYREKLRKARGQIYSLVDELLKLQ